MKSIEEDLVPGYVKGKGAALYLNSTERKVALYRQYDLLKYVKLGKSYVYKISWLDDFMEEWSGYDISSEAKLKYAIKVRNWRKDHAREEAQRKI